MRAGLRLTGSAVAVVVVLVLVLGGAASALAGRSVFVVTAIDSDHLAVRPGEISLTVHGDLSLHQIRYLSYGGAVARATARARVRACVPDCNLGKVEWPRARVRLSELTRCEGRLVYGRLGYALGGEIPTGVERRQRFDLLPADC